MLPLSVSGIAWQVVAEPIARLPFLHTAVRIEGFEPVWKGHLPGF
jgi:hypothetical protein